MLYCSDVGRSTTGQAYSQLAVPTFATQPGKLIQILKTGQGHWVTISITGISHPTVHVYDSLYSCAGTHLKVQIAAVMATERPELVLEFMDVPFHEFSTALALGQKPELLFFDHWNMRAHPRQCFEDGETKMFPVLRSKEV